MKYLWHLIGLSKINKLDTFLNGGLWLSRIDQFEDRLEGSLPAGNVGLLKKMLPPEMEQIACKEYELAAKRAYASCWHMSDDDPSERMWNGFGDKGNGIAIKTTPAALWNATGHLQGSDGPLYLGAVRYIDHNVCTLPEAQTLQTVFAVRKQYACEREARLLINCYGENAARLLGAKNMWGHPLVECLAKEHSGTGQYEFRGVVSDGRSSAGTAIVPSISQEFICEVLIGHRVALRTDLIAKLEKARIAVR
jgi:hypothetical protein